MSALLTLLGFALGAGIRGSNTMIPAHYHASIGGITAAFMTVTYLMLRAFGFSIPTRRLRRAAAWQPVTYGVGQMVFASGFALAGIYGMSRKAYGAEQAGRGLGESIGLGVMGIGGLIAVDRRTSLSRDRCRDLAAGIREPNSNTQTGHRSLKEVRMSPKNPTKNDRCKS